MTSTLHRTAAPRWIIALPLALAALASTPPSPSRAAADVTFAVYPANPAVGEPAVLVFRTWWTFVDSLSPADMTDYPFDVRLRGPVAERAGSTSAIVQIEPRPIDEMTWYAPLSFPAPGRWEVIFANWQAPFERALVVQVRPPSDGADAPSVPRATPAANAISGCPVTLWSTDSPPDEHTREFTNTWYGRNGLWAGLSAAYGGRWYADPDDVKVLWYREQAGQLSITGMRLDASAPPVEARIPSGYGAAGYQATALIFPSDGCWMVVGRAGEEELRFIVQALPSASHGDLTSDAVEPGEEVWTALRRPFDALVINPPGDCSPSPGANPGPVYPAGAALDGVLHGGNAKGWWAVDSTYRGPVLIRGIGPNELRFPYDGSERELHLWGAGNGKDPRVPNPDGSNDPDWRYWSLATHVSAAGCYAVQIDGWNFSYVLLMPARL